MIAVRTARRTLTCAAFAGALAAAAPAAAQTKADSADQAAQLFDKGNVLYKQSRWAEAEVQFQKAWELRRSFDVAANLGDCELEIGQNVEAAEHLAFAVREFPLSGKAALRERLGQRFVEARSRVGALKVAVSAQGAEVLVDGRRVGMAPLEDEVFVEAGAHTVEARLGEEQAGRANVEVAKGASKEVMVTLVKKGAAPPPGWRPNRAVLITGGAVAGVGLVVGTALAIVSDKKAGTAETTRAGLVVSNGPTACTGQNVPAACSAVQDAIRGKNTFGSAAAWSFIGAGTVGAATLIYALVTPRVVKSGGVWMAPAVATGGGGLVLAGTW
jgi:hypothetical protein